MPYEVKRGNNGGRIYRGYFARRDTLDRVTGGERLAAQRQLAELSLRSVNGRRRNS